MQISQGAYGPGSIYEGEMQRQQQSDQNLANQREHEREVWTGNLELFGALVGVYGYLRYQNGKHCRAVTQLRMKWSAALASSSAFACAFLAGTGT